ncbi:MAG: anhydro-N-acetylmuramic acid kinase [Planctomycetota bacterium]|nr:anhydro-N-acetylmuramic acid kinase [Planctomycetota bacterium]
MTHTSVPQFGRRRLRVAGLMSGTSADGVDAAIVDIGPRGVKLLAFETFPHPPALRRLIFALFDPAKARIDDLCHLNFVLGEAFASAVIRLARRSGIALASINLVGSHGQTVYHIPEGRREGRKVVRSTLQIGEPSVIAERTGIATVADFRPRDVAAGGEGAPLVPFADYILFRDARRTRAVQNIGGIANVTYLPAGGGAGDVIAFDTGPGNMMIDRVAWHATRGKAGYDKDGRLAARGRVDERLLGELMRHPYLRRRPPKSTGRETFGVQMTDALWRRARRRGLSPCDILATVTALTARSIAEAYRRFLPAMPGEVILCGGGADNPTLLAMLRRELLPARVAPMDEFGLDPRAKEAVSFAILAYATAEGIPNNVPSATGARRAVVLGKVVPG